MKKNEKQFFKCYFKKKNVRRKYKKCYFET